MNEKISSIDGGICAPVGFLASGIYAGITNKNIAVSSKENKPAQSETKKNDLGLIFSHTPCRVAAVYTQNKVQGAPIAITKKHLADGKAKAVIVNSRNANTCNRDGEEKARKMCELTANALGIKDTDVIVASTGVIGQVLDIDPIEKNIDRLVSLLSTAGSDACATAIMTTDLVKKEYAVEFELDGRICRIGGIAKGSGMIHPNMATMLCFICTDIDISNAMLTQMLGEVSKVTFNRVSVDGKQDNVQQNQCGWRYINQRYGLSYGKWSCWKSLH